jgi:hypothetical protein
MSPQLRYRKPSWTGIIAVLLLAAGAAKADVIVGFQSVSAKPGSIGDVLEVTINNTGPSPITVDAFSFGISTANPNIDFTDATTATVLPYIFAGNSLFGPDIATLRGQELIASDIYAGVNGAVISSGSTVGLGHVLFSIAPGAAPGIFPGRFDPIATSLSTVSGVAIPITSFAAGDITISEVHVIPEPSFTALLLLVSLLAVGRLVARNHSSRNAQG